MLKHESGKLTVLVVWEPILPSDWSRPTRPVMARIPDNRVVQFWDKDHLIAEQLSRQLRTKQPACCRYSGTLWDLVALYPNGTNWNESEPSYVDGPVFKVETELQNQTSKLLQSINTINASSAKQFGSYPSRLPALLQSFPSGYPHPPQGGPMLRSFARTFASSGIFLLFPLFVQAQASSFSSALLLPLRGKKQPATWKSPPASTPLPIFPSLLLAAKSEAPSSEFRGRVLSIYLVAFLGGSPLGGLTSGWLVSRFGSAPMMLVINGSVLTLVALYFLFSGQAPSTASRQRPRRLTAYYGRSPVDSRREKQP